MLGCDLSKRAAPFSTSAGDTEDVKQLSEPPGTPTFLMFLLPDLSSKSSYRICQVATWVESCSEELSHRDTRQQCVQHSHLTGLNAQYLTVSHPYAQKQPSYVTELSKKLQWREESGFKAMMLTAKMGEMKEEGCIIAGACGRNGRPLGCLTSILSLYINPTHWTALMCYIIHQHSTKQSGFNHNLMPTLFFSF